MTMKHMKINIVDLKSLFITDKSEIDNFDCESDQYKN